MKNFIKFFLILFVVNFVYTSSDSEGKSYDFEEILLGEESFINKEEYSKYLSTTSKMKIALDFANEKIIADNIFHNFTEQDLNYCREDLTDTRAELNLWKESCFSVRKELDPLRAENAVLKKDNNSWNGFKKGVYIVGIVAGVAITYLTLRIYHTLYYKDPKDDEIDKELVQLAENYEAWVANHRAEADEYTKGLYAEFDTAVVRRDIREGASPKDELLKYWAIYGDNIVHMMRRLAINLQDKELMESIFGC